MIWRILYAIYSLCFELFLVIAGFSMAKGFDLWVFFHSRGCRGCPMDGKIEAAKSLKGSGGAVIPFRRPTKGAPDVPGDPAN